LKNKTHYNTFKLCSEIINMYYEHKNDYLGKDNIREK